MMKYHNYFAKPQRIYGSDKLCSLQLINLLQQLRSKSSFSTTNAPNEATNLDANTKPPSSSMFEQEWAKAKPYQEMPTLGNLQMLKNTLPGGKYYKRDIAQMIMSIAEELGPINRTKAILGRPDAVMTHNPEDFEKVLRNEGIWPIRPGADGLNYHRSVYRADFFQGVEGLIGTQGEKWGSFRTVVNPILLQPKNVRLYLKKMSQVNKEFLERIIDIRDPHTYEVPADFEDELNRWTLESVSVVALDKQLGLIKTNRNNPEMKKFFGYLKDFCTYSVDVEFNPPIWKIIKTKAFKKLMAALDGITDITSKYVDEALQRIEDDRRNGVPEKPECEKSVLEKLIKTDKKIATVMAMDMLMAGVDTTSSSFAGLLLCLAKNTEKQAKLREEVVKALPNKDSEFDEASFKNLPYLRACIKESLRVYPLVLGAARHPVHDIVLSGYRIPKGTQVYAITASLLHSDAYYPRAKEYIPERWLRPSKDSPESSVECPYAGKSANPFIYIPFGFGARSCVGRRITEMEMELSIARLVRNFYIEYNHPMEKPFKSMFINMPNIPLKFKFTDVKD